LPHDFRQFDYDTISDVLLHLRYTARDGGDVLKRVVVEELQEAINNMVVGEERTGLFHLFSLKHDFPSEWHRFVTGNEDFKAIVKKEYFPYLVQGKDIVINMVELYAIQDDELPLVTPADVDVGDLTTDLQDNKEFEISLAPDGTVLVRDDEALVFLLLRYSVS
jgi:hypothetical protein